jgi:hypothetical protein
LLSIFDAIEWVARGLRIEGMPAGDLLGLVSAGDLLGLMADDCHTSDQRGGFPSLAGTEVRCATMRPPARASRAPRAD